MHPPETRFKIVSTSGMATMRVAGCLARALRPPVVLLLHGDLGAGKTTFVRGLVDALPGGKGLIVQSPTFALARTYATTPAVHHLDLYRLEDQGAVLELGLLDLLEEPQAISCVEWPGALEQNLGPLPVVSIEFSSAAGRRRSLTFDASRAENALPADISKQLRGATKGFRISTKSEA